MPDPQGQLSPAEILHVQNWLRGFGNGNVPFCLICRSQLWSVANYVAQSMSYPASYAQIVSPIVYPYVIVICGRCGYTMFLNAMIMGLYPPPQQGTGNVRP